MPLFQRCPPSASMASAPARSGFSTKRATAYPPEGSSSPRRMYPKPVSGAVGVMPNVTMRPVSAQARARATASANAACGLRT